jgi:hypothetical protein
MLKNRAGMTATLLRDGRVLVAGGQQLDHPDLAPFREAEIFDPTTGRWTATGSMATGRSSQFAIRLSDGRVLVAGGYADVAGCTNNSTWRAEIWDPSTKLWSDAPHMIKPRSDPSGVVLPDGRVLVAGGFLVDNCTARPNGGDRDINEAEVFTP